MQIIDNKTSGSYLWMLRYAVVLTHPEDRASKITDASSLDNPLPPWSSLV